MVKSSLPEKPLEFLDWRWEQIEPHYAELAVRPLDAANLHAWMTDWSRLSKLIYEALWRLTAATNINTADQEAERRYNNFIDVIQPAAQAAEQKLKEKLISTGLSPANFEIPLRNLRSEAALFRAQNLPLFSEELKLIAEYDKIIGAQMVSWQGEEVTVSQLEPVYLDSDREQRERAWRLAANRRLQDRQAISAVWEKLLTLRRQMAANAGMPDYRSFRWQQMLRFDYTPQNCKQFQQAIEQVVVPAASRIYEKRRRLLGVESLRPWDVEADPLGRPPLKPFETVDELEARCASMFNKVDGQLGEYFEIMRRQRLLDLDNRKNKAPGGYCQDFPASGFPFIFANCVGVHDDVQTILHEGGHAFHFFEVMRLPYHQQYYAPLEFMEVASMSMELLASPYLGSEMGGFYSQADVRRARVEHLERSLLFWPYMAVVDGFQHWAYENPEAAADPAACDACWDALWLRFMPGVDWSDLDQERMTGWQRKLHIYHDPFYYVEYGLAMLGAVQVWRGALRDQAGAVAAYRRALALGCTKTLPELFATAGARFDFDAETLGEAVDLLVGVIEKLEG